MEGSFFFGIYVYIYIIYFIMYLVHGLLSGTHCLLYVVYLGDIRISISGVCWDVGICGGSYIGVTQGVLNRPFRIL